MMRSFELSHHRRANVWLGEAPPAGFIAASVTKRTVEPRIAVAGSRRMAGVELYLPRGARVSYGLLGAELVEAEVAGLEVVVPVGGGECVFPSSLASKLDDVKIGLLDEYAAAVIDGAARIASSVGAPTSASLAFRWAAHGLIGSSRSIFETASGIVLQLLMLPEEASEDQIRALLDAQV